MIARGRAYDLVRKAGRSFSVAVFWNRPRAVVIRFEIESGGEMSQKQPEANDRPRSKDLDAILGKPFKILDDGFTRVVDYMGTDASIVQAARISHGAGTKRVQDDRNLIGYLMRHMHTTPFEMCEIKLHVRVPMDTWRQWIRHRTANVNEYSTRYSVAIDSAQTTSPDAWRLQDPGRKQGSEGVLPSEIGQRLTEEESALHVASRRVYKDRLASGVAREQARKDLPLSTYTEAYWKIDLHNLFHFLQLRMHPLAQFEIRTYANLIGFEFVQRWCPEAWRAFLRYRVNGLQLTEVEVNVIASLARDDRKAALRIAEEEGWVDASSRTQPSRERVECEKKLARLQMTAPWK